MCANTFSDGVAHAGGGRANERPAVVPSSWRGKYLQGDAREEDRAVLKGRHVVRGRQSSPIPECARVTGKAGEKRQNSGNRAAPHPGQDRHTSKALAWSCSV